VSKGQHSSAFLSPCSATARRGTLGNLSAEKPRLLLCQGLQTRVAFDSGPEESGFVSVQVFSGFERACGWVGRYAAAHRAHGMRPNIPQQPRPCYMPPARLESALTGR
jgi:hypothetical protein